MKLTALFAPALAISMAAPAIASAADYGTPGQIEAGGFFGIASQTATTKPEGGDETKDSLTVIQLDPTVGYFISDGLELLGTLHLTNASLKFDGADDPVTLTQIGLGAGAGYFVNMGFARVGPQVLLRFGTDTTDFGSDTSLSDQRLGAQVGAFAKLPVGGGGVLAAGLVFDYDTVGRKIEFGALDSESEGTETEFGARVGYLVFF